MATKDDYTRHHELGVDHVDFLLYRLEQRNGELADKGRRIANLQSLLARERYWHRLWKKAARDLGCYKRGSKISKLETLDGPSAKKEGDRLFWSLVSALSETKSPRDSS